MSWSALLPQNSRAEATAAHWFEEKFANGGVFFTLHFVTGKQKLVVINKLFECIQTVSCDLDSKESEGVEHLSLVHFYCCLFIFDNFFPRWHFIPRLPLHTGFFSFLSHHGCTAPVWGRGAQFPTWPIGGSRTLTFVAGPCARPAVFVFFACATAHTRTHTQWRLVPAKRLNCCKSFDFCILFFLTKHLCVRVCMCVYARV